MMDGSMLAKGLTLGFSIAAPVGPIGLLCINRTLTRGRLAGFVSGLGAATADSLYGIVAGYGLSAVSSTLVGHQRAFQLVGGIFLLYLGLRTLTKRPAGQAAVAAGDSLPGAYLSTLLLTVTNPATILSFAAAFAGLGLAAAGRDDLSAGLLVAGVFLGSALWWLILATVTDRLRDRVGARQLGWVNRAAGLIICGFGAVALATQAA